MFKKDFFFMSFTNLRFIWSLKLATINSRNSCSSAFLTPVLGAPKTASVWIFSFSLPISPLSSEMMVWYCETWYETSSTFFRTCKKSNEIRRTTFVFFFDSCDWPALLNHISLWPRPIIRYTNKSLTSNQICRSENHLESWRPFLKTKNSRNCVRKSKPWL